MKCSSSFLVHSTVFVCFQEQSQIIWKFRDSLQREVSLDALRGLLEYNDQDVRSGESKVLTALDCNFNVSDEICWEKVLLIVENDAACNNNRFTAFNPG